MLHSPYKYQVEKEGFSWSPDGSKFALVDDVNAQIMIYAANGSLMRTFASPVSPANGSQVFRFTLPKWSSSGDKFAVSLNITINYYGLDIEQPEDEGGIYIVDLVSGEFTRIYQHSEIKNTVESPLDNNVQSDPLPSADVRGLLWVRNDRYLVMQAAKQNSRYSQPYSWKLPIDGSMPPEMIFDEFSHLGLTSSLSSVFYVADHFPIVV